MAPVLLTSKDHIPIAFYKIKYNLNYPGVKNKDLTSLFPLLTFICCMAKSNLNDPTFKNKFI